MQFDATHFARFAAGIDHQAMNADAWQPQRIGSAMRPIYAAADISRSRMLCTSGIRLRFASNTTSLALRWRCTSPARLMYRGALIVDDAKPKPVGSKDTEGEWSGVIFQQKKAALREFDLWLPHLCRGEILAVGVDDECTLAPGPPLTRRWLAYGDSITQGMVCSLPTATAIARCTRALGVDTVNLGIGGAICDPRLAGTIPSLAFDLVSIAYGTNEYNTHRKVDEYAASARALIENIAGKCAGPLVVITPPRWIGREGQANEAGATLDDYRNAITAVAAGIPAVRLVDGLSLVPEDPKLLPDSVHPNDEGFAIYAENLLPHLKAT